jgi:Proline racemase
MEYGFSDRIRFIDTHAGGEPTRIVIEGGPDLGKGSMAERREIFRTKFDHFRSAVVNEPRGSMFLWAHCFVNRQTRLALQG